MGERVIDQYKNRITHIEQKIAKIRPVKNKEKESALYPDERSPVY